MPDSPESFENRLRALPLRQPSAALRDHTLEAATASAASPGRLGWTAWAAAAVIAVCTVVNAWADAVPASRPSSPPVQTAAPAKDPMTKELEALAGRPLLRGTVRCADGRGILETRRQLEALLGS